jgi:hypothetical protein
VIVEREREKQRQRPESQKYLAPLGDEFVKSAVRIDARRDEARKILEENIRIYRSLGLNVYADRCARWLRTFDLDPMRNDGIAEDEWRAKARNELLTPIETERASVVASRAAARVKAIVGGLPRGS